MRTRRGFMRGLAVTAGAALTGAMAPTSLRARLVVIGGGFGGAAAARALRQWMPSASVTLIERNLDYLACPFSNAVIGGLRNIESQRFGYQALASEGIELIYDEAIDIDPVTRAVTLRSGGLLEYDRLILSPGIDFRWGDIEGYDAAAADHLPHAWKAGTQTLLLKRQLEAMEDGGLVVISVPEAPFRCPPGPYERASLIANYLKRYKPASRILILDGQETFSKQPLFEEAWAQLYPGLIERRGARDFARVTAIDPRSRLLVTAFDSVRADVANVIPPQKAGLIADRAGVADMTGWCPVDPVSFLSRLQPDIHVIGDAIISAPMPKSAFAANLQGRLCALQIARILSGAEPEPSILTNTCYSLISDQGAVSITGVYSNDSGTFLSVEGAGGLSPSGAGAPIRAREAAQAAAWFENITRQTFG